MDAATPPLRYAVIGTGARSETYIRGIVGPHRSEATLRAVGDVNPGRIRHFQAMAREAGGAEPLDQALQQLGAQN